MVARRMSRPSRLSQSLALPRTHGRLAGPELAFVLLLALIYAGLSAYFVLHWAGTTASFGALEPAGLGLAD
jgi:hypothetical protein